MDTNRRPLTDKQQAIYDYILGCVQESGYQPSVRQIGKRFNIWPATVQDHIGALRHKGWLIREEYLHKRANRIPSDLLPKIKA